MSTSCRSRRLARTSAALLAAALTGCSGNGGSPPPPPGPIDAGAPPTAAAHARQPSGFALDVIGGDVTLLDGGAATPGALADGEVLLTGQGGHVEVRLLDGSVVELGGGGRYGFEMKDGRLVLRVERGQVFSRASKEGGDPKLSFEVLTPYGLTRVGHSEVSVSIGEAEATVDVMMGSATLLGADGKELVVTTGEVGVLNRVSAQGEDGLPSSPLSVSVSFGKAELKKAGAKGWMTVSIKKPATLASGDSVRVQVGEATILSRQENGGRITLRRGAVVGVGGAREVGGAGRWSVPLEAGAMEVEAGTAGPLSVDVGGDVRLEAERAARYEATRTPGGVEVVPSTGKVRIQAKGQAPVVVEAGRRATITAKGVALTEPERMPIALPTRPGVTVFHPGLPQVTLTWDAAAGPPWHLRVASDDAMKKVSFDGELQQPFFTVKAPAFGALFWTVEHQGEPVGKGAARFLPEPHSSELTSVKNEVPESTEKTTIFFQDKPPGLTFTWIPADQAASSRVSIYKAADLATPVLERTVTAASVDVPAPGLPEGRYAWSVTPLNAKGQPVRGGRMNKLEIAYDNGQATLLILAPKNGDAAAARVAVRGIAPEGSRLLVNDVAVALDEKGRFETTAVPLAGGRLSFHLLRNGVDSYTVRVLKPAR